MSKIPKPHSPDPSLIFLGNASLHKPNHITRYEYPCLLHLPLSSLRLQVPANASTRSRPHGQGRADFGTDGTTFLTISRAHGDTPPTSATLSTLLAHERKNDDKHSNALARAMSRVSAYPGNTLLQSGKFATKRGLVYIVKRTSSIPTSDNKHARDEAVYEIPCSEWKAMRPEGRLGHDSWWMRLHDLYQGATDRAYWSARDSMDRYGIAMPLVEWLPRPDVEGAVKLHRKKIRISNDPAEQACTLCSREWFVDSEYACQLKCGHWLCWECVTRRVDEAGRGNLYPSETDPETKYWRCPLCNAIHPVLVDRADIIRADELPYWRYKIARYRLDTFLTDWLTHLYSAEVERWCAPLPEHLQAIRADPKDVIKARTVYVRAREAEQFMSEVPIFVASLLDWGFSLDNPVKSPEADVLRTCLVDELRRLERSKKEFHTEELIEHMQEVGKKALKTFVVEDKAVRLGNPVFPPGYVAYRGFLCEWTARGCFLAGGARREITQFMEDMQTKKGAWWKDVREVWFNKGAAVQ